MGLHGLRPVQTRGWGAFSQTTTGTFYGTGPAHLTARKDLGVSAEGLRGWVKQAKTDRGQGPAGALTTAEREELVRLRRQVRELEQTVEVLGKETLNSTDRRNTSYWHSLNP